jgi:hypothetical protein
MTLRKGTWYSESDYLSATNRILNLINIDDIENDRELDRQLELKLGFDYDNIKGGRGTIYKNVLDAFDERKKEVGERVGRDGVVEVRTKPQKTKFLKIQRRKIGIEQLRRVGRVRLRISKVGGVSTLILHKNRYYNADKLIVYQVRGKWVTRRKPKKKNVVRKKRVVKKKMSVKTTKKSKL